MHARTFLLIAICLSLGAAPVAAADLTKIERTIAKEPKYQGKPKYCLLVYGVEAKFRVWLVLDGRTLYVDRNGNGDLTEANEAVPTQSPRTDRFAFRPGALTAPEGTKYTLSLVRTDEDGCDMAIEVKGHSYSQAGQDGPGRLRFADRAQDAPIVHFLGPLTLQRFEPQPCSISQGLKAQPLVRGQECHLAFSVGTPGLGQGTFAKYPDPPAAVADIRFADGKTLRVALAPEG